jgi:hypothetical protein
MAAFAQSQADYCARVGRLVHSHRHAFQGGENLAEGGSDFGARDVVDCWLRSKAGHREYLLSPRVTKAGVGVARRNGKTFVAWAFSDAQPAYPDCPHCRRHGLVRFHRRHERGKSLLRRFRAAVHSIKKAVRRLAGRIVSILR